MQGVLVVPNVAMHGYNTYHLEGRRNNSLAHGLLSIATEARRSGHDVSIVDLRQYADMGTAVQEILDRRPHFVGVGAMTVDFGIALELCEIVKKKQPEVTTVMGGVHATIAPEDAVEKGCVDYIIKGEAEWTFAKMLDESFVGFSQITEGERPDLDALLPIDRELVDYADGELMHGAAWNSSYPYVTIMVGRGCPHKCNFCWPVSDTMFGPRCRIRSIPHLMWELSYVMRRYKPAYIEFIDDLFFLNSAWVDEFIREYPRVCIETPFNVAVRADIACKRKDQIKALADIGLDTVNIGLESGCQRHLDFLCKGTTVEQNYEACRYLKSLGLKIVGNIIHGIPGETPSETLETVKLLRDGQVDFYSASFLTPYPGCALHEQYGQKFLPHEYAQMDRYASKAKIDGVNYDAIKMVLVGEGLR